MMIEEGERRGDGQGLNLVFEIRYSFKSWVLQTL